MKPNKLTSGTNLLWESSRMMLPQHTEQHLRHLANDQRLIKPELTKEEQQEMFEKQQEMFEKLKAAQSNTLEP